MRELPIVAGARHGVFTRAEALAAGWTPSALRHAVARQRLVVAGPGVYAPAVDPTVPAYRQRRDRFIVAGVAATLSTAGSVASHLSAAALAGLPVWSNPGRPCVTVPPSATGVRSPAHLHRATLSAGDIISNPVRRTAAARTVVDVAREHGLVEALVVGDAALHAARTTTDAIDRVLADCCNWPGIQRARRAVSMLDGRAESPLESVSRLVIARLGLPTPIPQVVLLDDRGFAMGRCDFYWPQFGLVGEVDGQEKYDAQPAATVRAEKWRQERFEDTGLTVVRWGRAEIVNAGLLRRKLTVGIARAQERTATPRWRVG